MNVLYKLFCRAYQAVFRALIPVLPYRQPQRLDAAQRAAHLWNIGKVLTDTPND